MNHHHPATLAGGPIPLHAKPPSGAGLERVVVINDASVARGGATGLALLSVRLLRAAGVPVTFITGDGGANPELADLGVDVVALGGIHIAAAGKLSALTNGIYNPAARRLVAGWIAAHDTPGTVYHLHGWSKILSPSIFAALAPVAARSLLHAHDFFLACPNGAFQDYARDEACSRVPLGGDCLLTNCDKRQYAQKLWRAARQQMLRFVQGSSFDATTVLIIHDRMRAFFLRSGFAAQRLQILRNPAEPFSTSRVTAECNDIFYYVGRIEMEKGVADAVSAAAAAGVRLRLIGDGPDRDAILRINPDIEILGWLPREAIGRIVADGRALVMPSRYPEPFGLVAAEASLSGLPVILSSRAFLAAEFESEGLGLACDTRDQAAFVATFQRMANSAPDAVETMSRKGFAGAAGLALPPEAWRDRLIALYEERCAPSSARREHDH